MQVEDDELPDDEINTQAGDILASPEEIKAAIEGLYSDASALKRMVAIASLLLERKAHLKRQYQPEDLLQEALERIAMGVRKWPKKSAGLFWACYWSDEKLVIKSRKDKIKRRRPCCNGARVYCYRWR